MCVPAVVVVCCLAVPAASRPEAGPPLNNVKHKVGINVTATAVVSAMRIRTAPPFVGRG
jgi:hypothetical protein